MKDNPKICVYAICKNESKFIDRWVASLKNEADYVVVLDTGSTDDSVEKLQAHAPFVTVKQYDYMKEVGYFRFDKARSDSLKLVPYDTDICVVFDLDQVPRAGWSQIIRNYFKEGKNEVYGYIIDHAKYQDDRDKWMSKNVHPNSPNWVWEGIIHEGIHYYGSEEVLGVFDQNFIIDHYPDESKDRTLYKTLLEYACKEYPKDPYYGIFLGIELDRRYSKEDSIAAFERCLNECDFTDNEEIHYQTYINLATAKIDIDPEYALDLLSKAEELNVQKTRRLYDRFATVYEKLNMIDKSIEYLKKGIATVQSNSNDWTEDSILFNGYMEDRLALFYLSKNNYFKAMEYTAKSLEQYYNSDKKSYLDNVDRLINNLQWYINKINEGKGEY